MLITSKDVAALLGVGQSTVSQWARTGKLQFEPTPLGRLYDRAQILELARKRAQPSDQA